MKSVGKIGLFSAVLATVAQADQFEMQHPVLGLSGNGGNQPASCHALYQQNNSLPSGVYTLTLGGSDTQAYCLMDATGGWTLVGAQFEANAVPWSGDLSNYDPSLASNNSFTFTDSQIPAHTDFAVGKDLTITEKVQNFSYHTGNIASTQVAGYAGSSQYLIHRNSEGFYYWHNPEQAYETVLEPLWRNSLTVELHTNASGVRHGENNFTWSFSPEHSGQSRGYGMQGAKLNNSPQSYAWTLWVK